MARTILNRVDPHSLLAERGLAFYDPRSAQDTLIDYDDLHVNAIRIEAVCTNILGSHFRANELCDEALQTEAVKRRPICWKFHILRDKLTALSRDPKGKLPDIEQWARQGRSWCEDHDDRLGLDLLDMTLARSYLLRGLDKKAGRLLYRKLDRTSQSQDMGQLHKARLFSRLAALHRKLGSEEEWRYFMDQALRLSRRAGLTKVASDLAREYGDRPACREILEQSASD